MVGALYCKTGAANCALKTALLPAVQGQTYRK
jgi:hypothetical protein